MVAAILNDVFTELTKRHAPNLILAAAVDGSSVSEKAVSGKSELTLCQYIETGLIPAYFPASWVDPNSYPSTVHCTLRQLVSSWNSC